MTVFIVWPHEIDADFREAYFSVVNEYVQESPQDNGTHFLIGSGRVTQEHIEHLSVLFPVVEFLDESPNWPAPNTFEME